DTETGQVTVDELVMAVDGGVIINPVTASGQVEGGMVQAAGYGAFEELAYDENGRVVNPRFGPYWIYRADDVPDLTTIFIETYEESGPFGAKAVAEIPLDGAGAALATPAYRAVGLRSKDAPLLREAVWRALQEKQVYPHPSRRPFGRLLPLSVPRRGEGVGTVKSRHCAAAIEVGIVEREP